MLSLRKLLLCALCTRIVYFFSFCLKDLPFEYITYVMQFWPGIRTRTKKERNDEMLSFRKLLLCVRVSSSSSLAK